MKACHRSCDEAVSYPLAIAQKSAMRREEIEKTRHHKKRPLPRQGAFSERSMKSISSVHSLTTRVPLYVSKKNLEPLNDT